MWPFKRTPIVDAETAAWHADNFAWLIRQFDGSGAFADTKLVLPKPGFFAFDGERGHPLAVRIFDQVKHYCGMSDWEVDLVPDDNPLAETAPVSAAMIAPQKHALGTFAVAGNRIHISYVPALLQRPDRLIATFAHELAHYLLATAAETPPCDDDEIEFLTDLAAVYLGFGIFLANTRFDFEVLHDGPLQGWRMGHSGYLPEADLIFALALFIRAKQLDAGEACDCLKPHLAKMLRRALHGLDDDDPGIIGIRQALASDGNSSGDRAHQAPTGDKNPDSS
jgi:hypothetical protein